jgi:DNA (cytosine-5)-methyltransferase 1
MKFLDFFSGIGGFRLGMEMAGHECLGHCEIDKYANISYAAIHKPKESEFFATDIRDIEPGELPDADCYCGGCPCQSFSIAGKRGGFDDTRGTLFFEVMRLAKVRKPRLLFLENVEGLLNHDNGRTFETILRTMDELGYDAEWQVLNSKDFGVPQNRERVFIIGHLRARGERKVFPIGQDSNAIDSVQGQCANTITARYYGAQTVGTYIAEREQIQKVKQIGNVMPTATRDNPNQGRVYDIDGIAPCLNKMDGGGREPLIKIRRGSENSGTVTPQIAHNARIRRLTPLECWRLQGFPDWAHEAAKNAGVSDSQRYKQAGNSVTVNVIYEIAKRL